MDTTHSITIPNEAKFLDVPYEKRWECLKDIIVPIYMTGKDDKGKSMTITKVSAFMKKQYSFHASESQYKNWFTKWGVRKRILKSEKNDVVSALGRRTHPGTSTSDITLGENKGVDKKQIKRYLNDQVRHHAQEVMTRAPGILLSWSLPYTAYTRALGSNPSDHPSPFATSGATPSYINVGSPEDTTPGGQSMTAVGPSPTMQLVREKLAYDRASLFLQGRSQQLLESCGRDDRITMVNYLHDLYLYSFVKAKYWGRGPRDWTAGMVSALTSRSLNVSSPPSFPLPLSPSTGHDGPDILKTPAQLCRWSMHVSKEQAYGNQVVPEYPSTMGEETDQFDIEDPASWKAWPENTTVDSAASFSTSLTQSISEGAFSKASPKDLPLSTKPITQSVLQFPSLLNADALRAAIVAGNSTLVQSLCDKLFESFDETADDSWIEDAYRIYPFHLAATYLDGGYTCCTILVDLLENFGWEDAFYHYFDNLGHTILDALMINILRSHTRATPDEVSRDFDPQNRFPGEEKSICGRWDADTPEVRQLFASGSARIPTSWKHPFCHTSAQAILHSTVAIFGSPTCPQIDVDSGLFIRHCTDCGLELRLGPLHTLIVVAYYLASRGMPGETMFGAVAILTCLISLGADPSLVKEISIEDILGTSESATCRHKRMDPLDLIRAVPEAVVAGWTEECRTGWCCLVDIMVLAMTSGGHSEQGLAENGDIESTDEEADRDSPIRNARPRCRVEKEFEAHSEWLKLPCLDSKLGVIWAAIQAELLTYRRIETGTPWISQNFSMGALRRWLAGETEAFETPLLDGRLNPHSRCGWFVEENAGEFICAHAEDACKTWFMNMDGHYDRVSFLRPAKFASAWAELR